MTSVDQRCPTCNAHVAVGAEWCTLCYADLRPAPEPVAEPDLTFADQLTALYAEQMAPTPAPDARAGSGLATEAGLQPGDAAAPDPEVSAAEAAERMLALLAAESDVPLNSIAGRFDSNGAKVALIAGGSVVLVVVLVGVMSLIGSLL